MVNGSMYGVTGPPGSIIVDPALIPPGIDPAASGETSGETDGMSDVLTLERLLERIEDTARRLDALIDAVAPLIQSPGISEGTAPSGSAAEEVEAVKEALIYTGFFREAVKLGMSPDVVADAYRLADFTGVTADLETKEVTGVKEAVNALLETKPYLFFIRQGDVGLETNPVKGPSSFPEQVESLARTLGVSPEFAAELVKKRSNRSGSGSVLSDIWRMPRANRLSFLETND